MARTAQAAPNDYAAFKSFVQTLQTKSAVVLWSEFVQGENDNVNIMSYDGSNDILVIIELEYYTGGGSASAGEAFSNYASTFSTDFPNAIALSAASNIGLANLW